MDFAQTPSKSRATKRLSSGAPRLGDNLDRETQPYLLLIAFLITIFPALYARAELVSCATVFQIAAAQTSATLTKFTQEVLIEQINATKEGFSASSLEVVSVVPLRAGINEVTFTVFLTTQNPLLSEWNGVEKYKVLIGKGMPLNEPRLVGASGVDFDFDALTQAARAPNPKSQTPGTLEHLAPPFQKNITIGKLSFLDRLQKKAPVTVEWHGPFPEQFSPESEDSFQSLPPGMKVWLTTPAFRKMAAKRQGDRLFLQAHGGLQQIVENKVYENTLLDRSLKWNEVEVGHVRMFDRFGSIISQSAIAIGGTSALNVDSVWGIYESMTKPASKPYLLEFAHVHPTYEWMWTTPSKFKSGLAVNDQHFALSPGDLREIRGFLGAAQYIRIKAVLPNGYSYTYTLDANGTPVLDPLE